MGWIEYILALVLFMASHRIPATPGLKARVEAALGRKGYIIAFSLISTGLLFWVIFAAGARLCRPVGSGDLATLVAQSGHAYCRVAKRVRSGCGQPVCL